MVYNAFLVLALLVAGFIFWKRGREEHFTEDILFDGFLISTLGGLIAARLVYVWLHLSEFGWSIPKWANVISHGGLALPFGAVAAMLLLVRYSHSRQWNVYGVLDMWMPALAAAAAIQQIGSVLTGGGATLTIRSLPIPASLILALVFLLSSRYLYMLEYRYRTYSWYKSGQDVAQTGFITALGLMLMGSALFPFAVLAHISNSTPSTLASIILFGISVIAGFVIMAVRSRMFGLNRKRR